MTKMEFLTTKSQEADDTNLRYVLELQRNSLLRQQQEFDAKYGTFTLAFLASFETLALLAFLTITTLLMRHRTTRNKTNYVTAIWAVLNSAVLIEKIARRFSFDGIINKPSGIEVIAEMLADLSRSYGTSLYIVWFFNRYCKKFKPKYDTTLYCLMFTPAIVCFGFIGYYWCYDEFVYQYYTPGSDIFNLAAYFVVTILFVCCQVINEECYSHSHCALLISVVNLVTNFPVCLTLVYTRFVLDVSWIYWFHTNFVDFALDLLICINAFIAVFTIYMFHKKHKKSDLENKQDILLE